MQRVEKDRDFAVSKRRADGAHFCHVRFLWRLDFKRFRRLCLFILRRRFFFRLPMVRELKGKEVPIRAPGVKHQFLGNPFPPYGLPINARKSLFINNMPDRAIRWPNESSEKGLAKAGKERAEGSIPSCGSKSSTFAKIKR